jgi:NitT/TauT family transport system substrate-binding protein
MKPVLMPGFVVPLALTILLAGCGAGTASPATPALSPASAPPNASASAAASTQRSPAAKPGASTDLRIGLIPSTNAAHILVPLDEGAFAARGLNVTITPVTDTAQAMISIASGQLDLGSFTLGPAALNAFARGTDMTIIAASGGDPPGHGAFAPVMVRTDLMDSGKVRSLADLKGLKVGLNGKGVILEYSLYKALALGGLKTSDVDIVTMPWPDMIVAFANKSLDAGLIGQPIAAQAEAKGVARILSDDYQPNNQNAIIGVNSKYLQQHKDAIVAFLEENLKAIRKLSNGNLKKDDQALAILQKWTKVSPDVIKQVPDPYWAKDGKINVQSIQDQQAYFLTTGELQYSQPVDINKLIDYSALDQALKNLGPS